MLHARLPPDFTTERLRLHLPDVADAPAVLRYFEDNREHLERWSPAAPPGFYTIDYWRGRMSQGRREYAEDRSLRLVIALREAPEHVVGTCNFSEFVRGAFQACFLGYGIAERHQGKGLMFEALSGAIEFVFDELRMHRVMANYLPTNERSGAVLRRLGFTVDGYARDYLFINGAWRDHVLTSITNTGLGRPETWPR